VDAVLSIGARWLHLASITVLLGGAFFARVAVGEMAERFKPWAYGAIGGILVSGIYNFMSKSSIPPHYHMWFGIKVLLALHVFAATILYRKGKPRSLTGIVISGAVIILISGYLRWISLA
jgi:hypothetical protein